MRPACRFLWSLVIFVPAALWAADHDPDAPRVPRAVAPPVLDGTLDEPVWAGALELELTYETRPAENGPPPVRTRVLVAYDADALYLAFDAEDPNPEQIRARLRDRDRAFDDDFVGIVVDPFDDHRRAFEFFANPLGVQMDLFYDDVSGTEDDTWDAIWDAAGRIHERGYTVEMAIPMRSLRFPAGGGEQTWGFDLLRFYPRTSRHRLSIHPMERGRNCYLCQSIHLRGFEGATPGRNLEVVPSLVASKSDAREDYGLPLESGDTELEPGINLRWGVTPNVILNATVNPDFSQVEADSAQLDVNTTFALFFPEKRPFFLEGADLFSSPLQVVYTRNVAEPDYGLKVSGKNRNDAFGAFATDDSVLNLLFPGSQGSDFDSFDIETENQVLRYRRDLAGGSTLGTVVTHRSGEGYDNLVYGVDGLWRPGKAHQLKYQLLGSASEYPDQIAIDYGQPQGRFDDRAAFMQYDWDTRENYAYVAYYDVGRDFRADMGFLPQVDYRKPIVGVGHNWFPTGGFFNKVQAKIDWDRTHDQAGRELEHEVESWVFADGLYQSYLEYGVVKRIDQEFEGRRFPHTFHNVYGEFTPTAWLSAGAYLRRGGAIDFDNVRPAKVRMFEPWVTLRPGRHLNVNLNVRRHRLDVDGGELFTAQVTDLRVTWQFNVRSYVRLVTQYFDVERDPALYVDPIEARERELANQLLFSYKINPQTVFFLGYSDGALALEEDSLQQQQRTLFAKVSYAWQL